MTTTFDMRRGVAETLGTAGLVFFGGAAIMLGLAGPLVALSFGVALALMILAFGGISGGHYNPAVTLGFFASNKISAKDMIAYWVFQLIGAALATWALKELLPVGAGTDLITKPMTTLSLNGAIAIEAAMTFVFVLVILSLVLDKRATTPVAPMAIGLTLFVGGLVSGGFTGGSLNPARSLSPALLADAVDQTQVFVYVVGPFIGALLAAYVAKFLRGEIGSVKKAPAAKPLAVKAAAPAAKKPAPKKKKKPAAKKPVAVA